MGQLGDRRLFSALDRTRVSRKLDATQADAKAGVADYLERIYNPHRRYSTSDI
jgi:hypothetical protein